MIAGRRDELRRVVSGGVVAGLVGGLVLSLFMLVGTLLRGQDAWLAAKGAALPLLGERAMRPGWDAGAVLLGLAGHFAVSVGWGLLFALLAYGLSRRATVVAGLAWGLVVWIGMFYVVLPLVGLREMARSMPIGVAIFEHLLFGLSVALGFLPYQRTVLRPTVTPTTPARPVTP